MCGTPVADLTIALRRFALFAPVAALLVGCGLDPTEQRKLNEVFSIADLDASVIQGEQAIDAGLYDEANVLFTRALQLQPTNRRAKLGLAEVLLAQGHYQEALGRFEESQTDPVLETRALQGKGIALLALNSRIPACAILEDVVARDPRLWRALNGVGRCYDMEQQWDRSVLAYRGALEIRPNSAVLHNNLGFSFVLQNRPADAAAEFVIALKRDPQLAVARANLRLALAAQGRYEEALIDVPKDEYARALNNAGFVAMMRGDYAQAESYLSRAMENSPAFNEVASRNLNHLQQIKK